jgi:hypothetical protein
MGCITNAAHSRADGDSDPGMDGPAEFQQILVPGIHLNHGSAGAQGHKDTLPAAVGKGGEPRGCLAGGGHLTPCIAFH